jgi:hypothetical protein
MIDIRALRSASCDIRLFSIVLLALIGAVGCSSNSTFISSSVNKVQPLQGHVYGGEQPVVGASIQLYAAGAPASGGGYGLGSTPLITGALPTTDSNGSFTITGDYTLPPAPSHFYIVSTGGSPGSGNPVNPNIVLLSAIGGCTATSGLSSSLFININEVTTIGSILALQPFLAAPASGNLAAPAIGTPSTAYNGLQNAFETVNNLISISTGAVVPSTQNWAASDSNGLIINTLGDILVHCVNSNPALTNYCTTLFSEATPSGATYTAADTSQSGWYIAQNPANNVSTLFGLVPPNPPFVGLSSVPASFAVTVPTSSSACQSSVTLATAENFVVLAGSTVTNTGSTVVSGGNLGLSPGTSVTGFPPGIVTYPAIQDVTDSAAAQAQIDLTSAYNSTAALSGAATLPADLGGLTLTPGLYLITSTALLSNNLTLDAQGDSDAVFIFQIGSTLTTAGSTQVILANGAQAKNIFWLVGTSATLGSNSIFKGVIMANASITLNTGVTLQGRALARTAAVTLAGNTITAP